MTIPAGCSRYTLSFWMRVTTAESSTTAQNDKLVVTLGTSTVATTYSNLDKNAGYVQKTVDITGQAGGTVSLKFTGTENNALQTTFALDDLALTVA